jgi:hypothetical protein
MDFAQTGLPDKPLFRTAFSAGWKKYMALHDDMSVKDAAAGYLRGPVAMARLIVERGGDCRCTAAAACLAAPAVFSGYPDGALDKKVVGFAQDVMSLEAKGARGLSSAMPALSADMRLFFQVSAIMLLDAMTEEEAPDHTVLNDAYADALGLYSAARGAVDTYSLDTRFEIAAMKVTTLLEDRSRIWVRFRDVVPRRVYA